MSNRILRTSSAFFIAAFLFLGPEFGVVTRLNAETESASYYVSPSGRPTGDGSLGNPWDLQTALNQPSSLRPGDTIWLRGGTYRGTFISRLTGSGSAPIILRQYPGERATLDGGNSSGDGILTIYGAYAWYWGFEIMSSDSVRVSSQVGSNPIDIGRGGG